MLAWAQPPPPRPSGGSRTISGPPSGFYRSMAKVMETVIPNTVFSVAGVSWLARLYHPVLCGLPGPAYVLGDDRSSPYRPGVP